MFLSIYVVFISKVIANIHSSQYNIVTQQKIFTRFDSVFHALFCCHFLLVSSGLSLRQQSVLWEEDFTLVFNFIRQPHRPSLRYLHNEELPLHPWALSLRSTFFHLSFTSVISASLDQSTSYTFSSSSYPSLFPSFPGTLRPWQYLQPKSFTGRAWHDCPLVVFTILCLRWGGKCTCWGAATPQGDRAPAWSSILLRYWTNPTTSDTARNQMWCGSDVSLFPKEEQTSRMTVLLEVQQWTGSHISLGCFSLFNSSKV